MLSSFLHEVKLSCGGPDSVGAHSGARRGKKLKYLFIAIIA